MPKGRPLQLTHNAQQQAIVAAFKHAWKGYKTHCWGKDELKPISGSCSTWFNLGLTLVDSLDTMWLMGLEEEFTAARNWVANEMVVAQNRDVNLFETTIRTLGGLLSAYHLSEDQIFLNRAVSWHCQLKLLIYFRFLQKELGDRLLPCFSTVSHIPYSDVNLATGRAHDPRWGPDSSVSEVTSIQLEFRDLTQLTGDLRYKEAVDRTMEKVQSQPKRHNLVPLFINVHTGNLRPGTLTLGARADSYYEYLLKQWLQTGRLEEK